MLNTSFHKHAYDETQNTIIIIDFDLARLCTLFKEKQSESKFSEIGIDLWSKRTGWFMIYVIHDDITRTRVNLHMKLIQCIIC